MRFASGLFIILLTGLMSFSAHGQSTLNIDHYSAGYGENFRWVYDIAQDRQGFIWLANHTGLRRYDGIEYITYQHNPNDTASLSNNTVLQVASDEDNIWAYANDGVLNRLELKSGKIFRINRYLKDGERLNQFFPDVKDFKQISNGSLIVLTTAYDAQKNNVATLWRYEREKKEMTHQLSIDLVDAKAEYFSERQDGKLWLWTTGGTYYLIDLSRGSHESHSMAQKSANEFPIDEKGRLWYPSRESSENLVFIDLPTELSIDKISQIYPDNLGNIWVYHNKEDLYHFDTENGQVERFVDPIFGKNNRSRLMQHLFVDKDGKYWNGHHFGAVRFTAQANRKFDLYDFEPSSNNNTLGRVLEIFEANTNELIVKDEFGSFFLVDKGSRSIRPLMYANSAAIKKQHYTVVQRKDGTFWMNQVDRLVQMDQKGRLRKSYPIEQEFPYTSIDVNQTYWQRLVVDSQDRLWLCKPEGVFMFDDATGQFESIDLNISPESVEATFRFASYDSETNRIFGIYPEGVYAIDCETQSVELLKMFEKEQTYDLMITNIYQRNGHLLLSSNKGLFGYDLINKTLMRVGYREGISSNLVYVTNGSDKYLWLATQNGLSQIDPIDSRVKNYYTENGLPSNEFNLGATLKTADGTMFFGTSKGLLSFNPSEFSMEKQQSIPFNISDVVSLNTKKKSYRFRPNMAYSMPDEIVIEPDERNVTFAFMLAHFDEIDANQYYYYMEGLEPDWVYNSNQNKVSYISIPPGRYTFRAKALGPNEIAEINELAIPIYVKQYWYLTDLAYAIYIVLMLLIVYRLNSIQMNRKLQKKTVAQMKELDLVKTRMYTNITHEFRTPLTVILGMNEATKAYTKDNDPKKLRQANELIDSNGKKVLNLINQMLELSKLESGLLEPNYKQGDIIEYLSYRLEAFDSYALDKGIQIVFEPSEKSIIMDYDHDKLSYIIDNLVSNAIKFSPAGGKIHIEANREMGPEGKPVFKLVVSDHGIGIAAADLVHIFDRYYQVDNAATRNVEGTGIGLSLVKELSKLLNGTVAASSTLNQGSTFTIRLPITNNAEVSNLSGHESSEEAKNETGLAFLDEVTAEESDAPLVLVVEDNQDVAHYLGVCLKDGFKLEFAQNGQEGLDKAIELIPDFIISDVMMPVMDGFELCQKVKNDERTSHVPVILLTGKADVDSRIEGLEHGANVYLAKPFHQKELLSHLQNLLKLRAEIQKRFAGIDFAKSEADNPESKFLIKARGIIAEHLEEDNFDITRLCELMFLSRAQLHRKLIALTGESTSKLIRKVQLEQAISLLRAGELNVSEIAFQVGFKTQAHFSRIFTQTYGVSPSQYTAD